MATRLQLPNGCWSSMPKISPKNYKTLRSTKGGPWRIYYRFHDPAHRKPKDVKVMAGINEIHDFKERKREAEAVLENEIRQLKAGYNPFVNRIVLTQRHAVQDVPNHIELIPALRLALRRKKVVQKTRDELERYIIGNVEKAARLLCLDMLLITEVKRKHILFILEKLPEILPNFTDNTFNHFRAYLRSLFTELMLLNEDIEVNPVAGIPKKRVRVKKRKVLTDEECIMVDRHLRIHQPEFHRFLEIFFRTGARITELLQVRGKDVDLEGQRFNVTIRKGQSERTDARTIVNSAVPLWKEALQKCRPEDFVFSWRLRPGTRAIRPDQIGKRWSKYVKKHNFGTEEKPYRITADFYALKHLYVTRISEAYGKTVARHFTGHTSDQMIDKIYDVGRDERMHREAKDVAVSFVPAAK